MQVSGIHWGIFLLLMTVAVTLGIVIAEKWQEKRAQRLAENAATE